MNLFLDVDGVLLATQGFELAVARHANEFLEFAIANFDCYWLTTHCRGDAQSVLDYLRPYAPDGMMSLLQQIRPTNFDVLKTDALQGEFLWLDDSPLQVEVNWLKERGLLDRWICVDTRKRPDDLLVAMERLKSATA